MRWAHPMCSHGIGLVACRRAFGSRACRYNYAGERLRPLPQRSADARLFAWLFAARDRDGQPNRFPALGRGMSP